MKTFVDYACSFDPAFRSRIRGASPHEIADLEAAVGRPLPRVYKDFLAWMGRGADGLLGAPEVRSDVSEIVEFYRDEVATGEDRVPDDCVVIGVSGASIDQVLLECGDSGGVFEGGYGEKGTRWADSLEKLLYRGVYERYRPKMFLFSGDFSSACAEHKIEIAGAESLRLGFSAEWFSDSVSFYGETRGCALMLHQFAGRGLLMRVAADDQEWIARMWRSMTKATGLSLQRTP